LNQKPWHPLNFKNQARVYEAEQETIATAKRNAIAKVKAPLCSRMHLNHACCRSLHQTAVHHDCLAAATRPRPSAASVQQRDRF